MGRLVIWVVRAGISGVGAAAAAFSWNLTLLETGGSLEAVDTAQVVFALLCGGVASTLIVFPVKRIVSACLGEKAWWICAILAVLLISTPVALLSSIYVSAPFTFAYCFVLLWNGIGGGRGQTTDRC